MSYFKIKIIIYILLLLLIFIFSNYYCREFLGYKLMANKKQIIYLFIIYTVFFIVVSQRGFLWYLFVTFLQVLFFSTWEGNVLIIKFKDFVYNLLLKNSSSIGFLKLLDEPAESSKAKEVFCKASANGSENTESVLVEDEKVSKARTWREFLWEYRYYIAAGITIAVIAILYIIYGGPPGGGSGLDPNSPVADLFLKVSAISEGRAKSLLHEKPVHYNYGFIDPSVLNYWVTSLNYPGNFYYYAGPTEAIFKGLKLYLIAETFRLFGIPRLHGASVLTFRYYRTYYMSLHEKATLYFYIERGYWPWETPPPPPPTPPQ